MNNIRRGYVPTDFKEFNEESQILLRKAQEDILYLLERGYPMKSASTFVCNHYMLSERQRLALARSTATRDIIKMRKDKQLTSLTPGATVHIDGLNLIITLEVALSGSTLIRCMDDTVRDLAGLRGTYRIIDKTNEAILLLGDQLAKLQVGKVIFYLDAPVSNTGRLKMKLLELLRDYPFQIDVELVYNADVILETMEHVISSDAIILNKCISWINMVHDILSEKLPEVSYVDLSEVNAR